MADRHIGFRAWRAMLGLKLTIDTLVREVRDG